MAEQSLDLVDPLDPNDAEKAREYIAQSEDDTRAKKEAYLRRRREAYIRLSQDKPMEGDWAIIMGDLRRFCRGDQTPWSPDMRIHALLTGRNEVYRRIRQHIDLPFDELFEILDGSTEEDVI